MASMYDKPVRLLMQEMIPALGIKPGDMFTREQAVRWFEKNYPKIKQGTVAAHLIRLSTNAPSRVQYSVRADGADDQFFKGIRIWLCFLTGERFLTHTPKTGLCCGSPS